MTASTKICQHIPLFLNRTAMPDTSHEGLRAHLERNSLIISNNKKSFEQMSSKTSLIRINEAKDSPKRQRGLRKQINGKIIIQVALMKINKKNHCHNIFLGQYLKSRTSFIQLKPILDISLRGFSLSSCPQHSLKVLLLLNPTRLLKACAQLRTEFFTFHISIWINRNPISEGSLYCMPSAHFT
jgi:hypothetical protein